MRKRLILFVLAGLLLLPTSTLAAFNNSPATVESITRYVEWRDEYRTDFAWPSVSQWDRMRVYFETPDGVPYSLSYSQAEASRIFYLTCNGTYQYFFDQGEDERFWTKQIVTTEINNPGCQSYGDGGGSRNDLGADYSDLPGGGYQLHWNDWPGAETYEIWKDGTKIGTVPSNGSSGSYSYDIDSSGAVSIVAKDSDGNYLGHSDMQVPEYTGGDDWGNGGGGSGGGCIGSCEDLRKLLDCPEWDEYMSDLTGVIEAALPPPPDWEHIADLIGEATVRHLADYLGPVPEPPSQAEIDSALSTTLPDVDGGSDTAESLVPSVPSGYEEAKPFDITSGSQIEIVDDSQPFNIMDPLSNMEHDDPGVPVLPGDPRNNSGGIELPSSIDLPMSLPSQSTSPMPSDPIPIPGAHPGEGPAPSSQPGTIPIPGQIGGVIPIPNIP